MDGSKLLIISSIFIRFFLVSQCSDWLKYSMADNYIWWWNIVQGIVLLLFPLFGWIADRYNLHYKMIRLAFILVAVSAFLMLITAIGRLVHFSPSMESIRDIVNLSLSVVILISGLVGLGIYEANVIQFGLHQLFEAPTEHLSKFVHWYFWGTHVSPLLVYYTTVVAFWYAKRCKIKVYRHDSNVSLLGLAVLLPSLFQTLTAIFGIIFIHKCKSYFETDLARFNPFKVVVKVLRYTLKHKQPERRSAFTYWETTTPSRIDFGKQKYGGPFTNEEVEDTKVFFRLLLLLASLFGFFLQGSGHSFVSVLICKLGCPPTGSLLSLALNPNHVTLVTILIGVPMYQFIIKRKLLKYVPNLLTRIWIGMVCCLVREFVKAMFNIALPPSTAPSVLIGLNKTAKFMVTHRPSTITMCILSVTKVVKSNGECTLYSPGLISDSYLFYLLVIPQVIHGLSFLLVFMTVLEFICAQAPHTMKGLLIGIWYAMFSIQFLGTESIPIHPINIDKADINYWVSYNGGIGLCIFASLALYSLVVKFYRYRERNEVVNEQAIIEELYERELMLNASPNTSYDSIEK